jgi:hypothetical protein
MVISLENLNNERDKHLSCGDKAPCIQIRRLTSGLPERLRSKRWFVILQVGLDESGHGQTGPHEAFVFAGYVGPVTLVETFTHAWDAILNIPPAMSVRTLKKRLRSGHIDPRVVSLAQVISPCELHGVRFKVAQDDYAEMAEELAQMVVDHPERSAYLFDSTNPYFFAFIAVLTNLIAPIRDDPDAKIEVIYDENMHERKRLEYGYQLFRDFARKTDPTLLTKLAKDPLPRNDEEFSLLQAADMLAWHSHKAHVESSQGRVYKNEIWSIVNDVPFFVDEHWNKHDLRALITGAERPRTR